MASPPDNGLQKRAQVVMFAPALPSRSANNAGSRYAYWTAEALSRRADVLVISLGGPASQRALDADAWTHHVLLRPSATRRGRGYLSRATRALVPVQVAFAYVRALLLDQEVKRVVRSADIIDLQWQEQGLLVPLITLLNRRARIVCTLHDVLSQRFERAKAESRSRAQRLRWTWAQRCASWLERHLVHHIDTLVVFSEKDRSLVRSGRAEIHVVAPPVGLGLQEHSRSPVPGCVLFVGLLSRWENEEGLRWFLTQVWPLVMSRVPQAKFHIAGAHASPDLMSEAAGVNAELLGFVDDLDRLYATASVVVAPLRLGAGVKFKVLEAVLAGTPVVTTSVGAEGIGDASWFAGGAVYETAPEFAAALSAVLEDPAAAESDAERVRLLAAASFGGGGFGDQLERVYRMRKGTAHAG